MHVFAVGRKVTSYVLWIQIRGFIDAKPIVGGREQEVTKSRNADFCSGLNSDKTLQRSIIVWLFSKYPL